MAERQFLAMIADDDSTTGLLLAGIGHVENNESNFFIADARTEAAAIEQAFDKFINRKDIGILLINQYLADKIRYRVDTYTQAFPSLLEIPSKDHPYDIERDSIANRVRRLFGE